MPSEHFKLAEATCRLQMHFVKEVHRYVAGAHSIIAKNCITRIFIGLNRVGFHATLTGGAIPSTQASRDDQKDTIAVTNIVSARVYAVSYAVNSSRKASLISSITVDGAY